MIYNLECTQCKEKYSLDKEKYIEEIDSGDMTFFNLIEECKFCHGKLEQYSLRDPDKPLFRDASFVRKVTTVGQLAEQNSKRLGKAELEERIEANKTKREPAGDNISKRAMELPKGSERKIMKPTKIDKDLVGMTSEQMKRYVLDGVKPVKNTPSIKDLKKLKKEKALEKKGQKTRIISA